MKYLLFIISFALTFQLFAQEETTDSLQTSTPTEYVGYRIFANDATIIKDKKSYFILSIQLTNTGRLSLSSQPKKVFTDSLILKTTSALQAIKKEAYQDLVDAKIRKSKPSLAAGESKIFEYKIKLPKNRRLSGDNFTVNTGQQEITKDYSRELCPDLIVDSLVLVKRTPKYAIVSFEIKNIGKGAISVGGDSKIEEDNIAVGAYFSGTKKYSRGALQAGMIYLDAPKENQGILFPGDSIKGEMKVSRKNQSKYTRVLIIVVDAGGVVIECNESNNYQSVLLR